MLMTRCRFVLKIRGTDRFHCAAEQDGWARTWTLNERWRDPCDDCNKRVPGAAVTVDAELKPSEFWHAAGQRIRETDWRFWQEQKAAEPAELDKRWVLSEKEND